MAVVTRTGVEISTLDGKSVQPQVHTIAWDPIAAEKGPYRHFMQKEIAEQPRAVTDTIRGRVDFHSAQVHLDTLMLTDTEAQALQKIILVACGTSYHAGLVGKFMLENLAHVPVEVDYSSEFRYRHPLIGPNTAVLTITQSGETVDTLAAMEEGRRQGAKLWSIVNVLGSQAQRISDGYILMQAGPEIGVASTKAFTTSLVDLYLLALTLGEKRGVLSPVQRKQHVAELARLPQLLGQVAEDGETCRELAELFHKRQHFLYLGRGLNYPIALEGALKLKEISYIHAEGYPAGEMKHGPIALIDEMMPVVTLAPRDEVYDKMISQIEQVKARGGTVIALIQEGDEIARSKADYVLEVPATSPYLAPVVNVIPLQWLAYAIAVRRGRTSISPEPGEERDRRVRNRNWGREKIPAPNFCLYSRIYVIIYPCSLSWHPEEARKWLLVQAIRLSRCTDRSFCGRCPSRSSTSGCRSSASSSGPALSRSGGCSPSSR
jgi:glucosamine--fructose-6-phosphate aminotransferase (isomerizing)